MPLIALLGATTCSEAPPPNPDTAAGAGRDSLVGAAGTKAYERGVVFYSSVGDSTLLVPWLVEATAGPEGVERRARAWICRGGVWEEFLSESWTGPPTNAPWRILPHGPMRLVVSESEALEALIFQDGEREMDLELEDAIVEWTGRRGGTFRLLDGALVLGGSRTEGLVLDLARTRADGAGAAGDWMLLAAGDSLRVVLQADGPAVAGESVFRGWGRLGFGELSFPAVRVGWAEARAFESARRDVPVAWSLDSNGGALTGRLERSSTELTAGTGEEALRPVDAWFEVVGSISIQGTTYAVRGLLRHTQS